MRTPLAVLAGSLLLGGCITSPAVVYVPVPADSTVAAPVPVASPPEYVEETIPPVGVSIVRAEGSDVLLTTNQPAYVAVFEIVPNRGVTLLYPTSARRPDVELTGSRWVTVEWMADRPEYRDDQRARRTSAIADRSAPAPVRYVYTLASARPLRLSARTFDDAYLRDLLGARTYRASDPYETMDALARHLVPRQPDEDWGEDLLTMDVSRSREPVQVTRVYCPDGSVTYVRDDLARRAWCPTPRRGAGPITSRIPRPDSVVASNGTRVPRRETPAGGQPIFRVPRRPYIPGTGIDRDTTERDGNRRANNGNGNSGTHGNNGDRGNHGNGNNGNAGRPADGPGARPRGLPVARPQGMPRRPQSDSTPGAQPQDSGSRTDSVVVRRRIIPERERPDSAVVRRRVIPERQRPQGAAPARRVIPASPRPDSQPVAPKATPAAQPTPAATPAPATPQDSAAAPSNDDGDSSAARPGRRPVARPTPKAKPSRNAAKDSSAHGHTPAAPLG